MNSIGDKSAPVFGVAAEFSCARDLYHAAEKIRDAGFRRWDVFSPFPIHGMDEAMGMRRSLLGKIVFIGGLSGFLMAVVLQFGPSSVLYPLVVAGKPTNLFTVPAFFPIMFEMTILFSAFTAVFGMLIMNGLPRLNHALFNWDRFKKVTEDKFFVAIESGDPKFSERAVRDLLESLGGTNITTIHGD
ncbi:MAG: DUF3341 domain-containing protein [Chthoniobacterales bacterium]|nr:DUF3341 domain-containing protein [Chthoniobacterales bacterium]